MARRRADKEDESTEKGRARRLYTLPLRLILLFLLLVWLMYVLADSYGIEGEGGWLGEIMGSFLFILGIIVAAGAMVGAVKIIRGITSDDKNAATPWGDSGEDRQDDSAGDSAGDSKPGSGADDAGDADDRE